MGMHSTDDDQHRAVDVWRLGSVCERSVGLGSMAPGRGNDPKPHQYRNLTFTDRKPAFLQNIGQALRGSPATDRSDTEVLDPSRPAIPVRPGRADEADDEEPLVVEEDGRARDDDDEEGDDAPTVVVLKEGRHLTKEQAEEERIRARDNPQTASNVPSSSKPSIKPSLNFSSSNTGAKRKLDPSSDRFGLSASNEGEDWASMLDHVKGGDAKSLDQGVKDAIERGRVEQGTTKSKAEKEREERESKEAKRRKKEDRKAKDKKARGLMSFEE